MLANHKVRTWGPEVEAEGFNNDALIVIWQRDYRKADVYSRQLLQNSCLATHSNRTWVSVAEVVREKGKWIWMGQRWLKGGVNGGGGWWYLMGMMWI